MNDFDVGSSGQNEMKESGAKFSQASGNALFSEANRGGRRVRSDGVYPLDLRNVAYPRA